MRRFSCWWINRSNNLTLFSLSPLPLFPPYVLQPFTPTLQSNAEWLPQIIESCDISQGALLISLTLALAGSASTQFIFHSFLSSGLLVAGSIYSKVQPSSWPCWRLGQRECKEWILFRAHFFICTHPGTIQW